jgi:hypothetical protein
MFYWLSAGCVRQQARTSARRDAVEACHVCVASLTTHTRGGVHSREPHAADGGASCAGHGSARVQGAACDVVLCATASHSTHAVTPWAAPHSAIAGVAGAGRRARGVRGRGGHSYGLGQRHHQGALVCATLFDSEGVLSLWAPGVVRCAHVCMPCFRCQCVCHV